jgi:hypothetical protein
MSNNYGFYLGGENNAGDYIGVVDGREIAFESRQAYLDYLDEIRTENEQEDNDSMFYIGMYSHSGKPDKLYWFDMRE